MYPVLFTIGSFEVYSQDVLVVLGALVAGIVFRRLSLQAGINRWDLIVLIAISLPCAYLVSYLNGRFFGLLQFWFVADANFISPVGLVSFGTIAGLLLSGYLVARWRGLPQYQVLDRMALVLPLAHSIGRIGCLLNGCCYGLKTNAFLAMYLPGFSDVWAYRYPTQIMLSLFNLGLFVWLWWYKDRTAFEGSLTLSFLFLYALGRLFIDALRDLPHVLGPLSLHQLTAIAILLFTSILMLERSKASTHETGMSG